MDGWMLWAAFVAAGYLAGSVPFGLLIGKARGVDVRREGSGNIGATNVGRVLGKRYGIACFVLDVAKGAAPVLAYGLASGAATGGLDGAASALRWVAVAAAAMAGHVFPAWLGFRGGKGVATGLGVTLALWPAVTLAGLAAAALWVAAVHATGYVSVGSVAAAAALPVFTALAAWAAGLGGGEVAVFAGVTGLLGVLVVVRHASNLKRLRHGAEARVGWAWATKRAARSADAT